MCGIAGWVDFATDLTAHAATARAMTTTMACRGPDDSGVWVSEHTLLGHQRLAIIDLPGGRQPMREGEVVLTYSGEVYNYPELRAELSAAGHRFRTASDTEVVLRAYLQWGDALVERLNGMYALAIWDGRAQRLLLVRDRLGIKPLYYYPTASGVHFGSEPKAILANPAVRRRVGLSGLRDLIGWTMAPGWSLWQGMHEVEPGQSVVVDRAGCRARTYWRLTAAEHPDDLETTVSSVRDLLTDIVERQLVADVPRCVLLSGGLDSSSITGLAAARLRADGQRLRTFSVDFTGREHAFRQDEVRDTPDTPFIRDVVDLVGSDHETISLNPSAVSDPELRRAVITARDLPLGFGEMDTSLYLLFQAIRARSTVALSGEAADEVFGGYRWFHDEAAIGSGTFPWLAFQSAMSGDRAAVIHPDLRAALDIPTYVADEYATAVARVPHLDGHDPAERRMRVATHLHLTRFVRMLLDRKDRVSMAVGLEVRVPFCDHRLVEYAFNVPWSMKTFDGREKSLLRHAAAHVLPASARDRRKASYPSIQDPAYLTALQQQAKEVLADAAHPVHDLVDRAWLTDAVALDPHTVPSHIRRGIDRVLDLYHWIDLYRPEILG
jgi:asparagine synthase (glutamine-hydrolysing)